MFPQIQSSMMSDYIQLNSKILLSVYSTKSFSNKCNVYCYLKKLGKTCQVPRRSKKSQWHWPIIIFLNSSYESWQVIILSHAPHNINPKKYLYTSDMKYKIYFLFLYLSWSGSFASSINNPTIGKNNLQIQNIFLDCSIPHCIRSTCT